MKKIVCYKKVLYAGQKYFDTLKPGLKSPDVREKHKAAQQAYLYWIDNHKPKSGPLFDVMKES